MRVLITGASGYIGQHVVPRLRAGDIDVHAASRRPDRSEAVWHQVDLLDPAARARLVADVRPNAILHLAWNAIPGVYWTTPENLEWRRATRDLAEVAAFYGLRRFVGAGTCAEYDWTGGQCDEVMTPLRPATLYGQSKLSAWRDVEELAGGRFSVAWGRIFFIFGGPEHPARLVPSVMLPLLRGEPALCSHGRQIRDFLHVEDLAEALIALLLSNVEGALNLAAGESHRVLDVIHGIAERVGRHDLVRLGARPANDPPVLTASVRRLRDEVGWSPNRTFEEALDLAVRYWLDRGSASASSPRVDEQKT